MVHMCRYFTGDPLNFFDTAFCVPRCSATQEYFTEYLCAAKFSFPLTADVSDQLNNQESSTLFTGRGGPFALAPDLSHMSYIK